MASPSESRRSVRLTGLSPNLSSMEWLEFWSLHGEAKAALEAAAENGMLCVQATNALRALFIRAKLL
jgi:hypothetical protein